jgi:hypothetical protein
LSIIAFLTNTLLKNRNFTNCTIGISSFIDISQTIRDDNSKLIVKISGGEIRDHNSRKLGSIASDGTVRNYSSKKLGTVQESRVINENSQTLFKYDDSGTVRDRNGMLLYRINNGDIRNSSSKLLFKYGGIELTHLLAYLCFFNL